MLRKQGQEAVVLHLNRQVGVYGILLKLRHWALGARERLPSLPLGTAAPGGRIQRAVVSLKRTSSRVLWAKPLRRLFYVVDLLTFVACRAYHEGLRGRVLIMDRYLYDTLVDVSVPRGRMWLKVLQAITPEPGHAVLLEVSPEEAFARKGERTLEELRQRAAAYRAIFDSLKHPLVLSSTSSGETAVALERMLAVK